MPKGYFYNNEVSISSEACYSNEVDISSEARYKKTEVGPLKISISGDFYFFLILIAFPSVRASATFLRAEVRIL